MYVNIKLPEIKEHSRGFPGYWMRVIFSGSPAQEYADHAIMSTYVRSIESALYSYGAARQGAIRYWDHGGNLNWADLMASSSHLEHCITDTHRAIEMLRALYRRPDLPKEILGWISPKPDVLKGATRERIRKMRVAIHHLDDLVRRGELPANSPFFPRVGGPEEPLPSEPGQTIKTIDRVELGTMEVRFEELRSWLLDLAAIASRMAGGPVPSVPSHLQM